jgi:hypothetical protein
VLGAASPGERLLIVDCPSVEHLRLLRAHPALQSDGVAAAGPADGGEGGAVGGEGGADAKAAAVRAGEQGGKRAEPGDAAVATEGAAAAEVKEGGAAVPPLHAVIHLTSHAVRESAEYTAWCASLPAAAIQLFTGEAPQPQRFAFLTAARLQMLMHGVHGKVRPPPRLQPPTEHDSNPLSQAG